MNQETIAAIATPAGRGGIGVVRISGELVRQLMQPLLGREIAPRQACYTPFHDESGCVADTGIALYFPAPHSFTGEDILELQCHGSPMVLDILLRALQTLGVRLARPGEFALRAFLNGKIDLAQAEAISDLIESSTEAAARSAQNTLQGAFSRTVNTLVEQLIQLRLYVEASIDFSDEEIDFISEHGVRQKMQNLLDQLERTRQSARQGALLREGLTLVIAGKPNAGKSSLMNYLAGRETAIVTSQPGTTRDILREYIQIDGMPLHLIDTAGLRDSNDPIEQEGMRRAREAMRNAGRILFIMDESAKRPEDNEILPELLPGNIPVTCIHNKIDKSGARPGIQTIGGNVHIHLSVKTGKGMDILKTHLKQIAGYDDDSGETVFTARRRHLDALRQAQDHIGSALTLIAHSGPLELSAEEMRLAQQALSEITGKFTTEQLLDRVFSSFCIGK
ncbi:tRNA uridine-5-carboxymethylaminomethyl(34) synthesis GTPase MnmE [Candidatus Methylospira mobilis]|uniref:tRNA modification GTPase MnmE n=1 Tax=Candidatus Methylospira mobilis TaxID=1808979 RepID=A0A5Q0BQX4_9GAMM|nr:tRNA uridine-5-carboxymethylaminomethyl(34) synthesis GTPase MnmE [Candidatus Methylospira mobilis]QFY44701.1 tRNA uridine-5-carboxymethylaminomethyl(34) synthesis GTPase MnmE [Candidatus Methylospira mobilis]WNV05758.1 tRNA uridine-5-carboxymethylaminomethyl(34) synthesis GTPase MnmE [Candidatus Methylospira mobilis]